MEDKICAWIYNGKRCKVRLVDLGNHPVYCKRHQKEASNLRKREAYRKSTRCAHSTHIYHTKYCYILQPTCAFWDGLSKSEYNLYKNDFPKGTQIKFA